MTVTVAEEERATLARHSWWAAALLIHAGALAVIAARTPLWSDEGFTAEFIRSGWSMMFARLADVDVNMTVYYVVVKLWSDLAGSSDFAMRVPTIFSLTLAVLALYFLVRRALGRKTALLAAFLLAVSPFAIAVALTARPYALLLLLAIVSSGMLLRAIETASWPWWVGYTAVIVIMQYTHLMGITVIVAHGMYALSRTRRPTLPILMVVGVLAVSAAVNAHFLAAQNTLAWIPAPSVSGFLHSVEQAWGGLIAGPVLLLTALNGLRTSRELALTKLCALWAVVPIVCIVAMLPVQSLLQALYFTQTLPPLCVLAAGGINAAAARFPRRALHVWVPAFLMLAAAVSVPAHPGVVNEDWRTTAHELGAIATSQDLIVFPTPYYRIVAEHYARDDPGMFRAAPRLPGWSWLSADAYQINELTRLNRLPNPGAARQQIGTTSPVLLVGPDDAAFDQMREILLGAGFRQQERRSVGDIHIDRLVPPGAP